MVINTRGQIQQSPYAGFVEDSQRIDRNPLGPLSPQIPILSDQALKQEGKNEQKIHIAAKKAKDKQVVEDLIKKSNRCIIRISSLFPWDFFPDTIQVEESRVTIIFNQFFASQSQSVDIKDISNVIIQTSPFFATLQIVARTYIQNDITIGHLHKNTARKVHMIIEGLRTFAGHNIDTSGYEIDELISKIEEFHTNKTM